VRPESAENNTFTVRRRRRKQFLARSWSVQPQGGTILDVGEDEPRQHPIDGDHLHILLTGRDVANGVSESGTLLGPEVVIGFVQHLDVVEHFDPVGCIPAGYDQSQWEAIQEWQQLPFIA